MNFLDQNKPVRLSSFFEAANFLPGCSYFCSLARRVQLYIVKWTCRCEIPLFVCDEKIKVISLGRQPESTTKKLLPHRIDIEDEPSLRTRK